MTTEELLKECMNRDRTAWDEFVRRYEGLVTRSVRYKLNRLNMRVSEIEYSDIVQEVFLLIWDKNKLLGVKNATTLKGWLAILSINTASNYCRKRYKEINKTLSLNTPVYTENNSHITLESLLPSSKLNTGDMIERSETLSAVKNEIDKLNPKQRLALKLDLFNGKRQKDIAEIMNIPINTVASLIRRAKQNIQQGLENFYN